MIVVIKIVTLDKVDLPDFKVHLPAPKRQDPPRKVFTWPVVQVVTEDGRHYNGLLSRREDDIPAPALRQQVT